MTDDLTSLVSALDMMERWKQRAEAAEAKLHEERGEHRRVVEVDDFRYRDLEAKLAECRGDLESHKWAGDRVVAAEAELSKLAECVKALKAREAALREALEGVMPWMPKADSRCVPDEWVAAAKIISNTKDKSDGKKGK